jgi:hypothetical protein
VDNEEALVEDLDVVKVVEVIQREVELKLYSLNDITAFKQDPVKEYRVKNTFIKAIEADEAIGEDDNVEEMDKESARSWLPISLNSGSFVPSMMRSTDFTI